MKKCCIFEKRKIWTLAPTYGPVLKFKMAKNGHALSLETRDEAILIFKNEWHNEA